MFTKEELIDHLENGTQVFRSDKSLKDAFLAIDRKDFVSEDYAEEVYEDYALPIGYEQTISQPTTVAFMLELLGVEKGDKVLDVGSGSGFTSALLAHMVGESGKVIGVERVQELVGFGQENLNKYDFKNVEIVKSDKEVGLSSDAPYDKILVSAAAEEVPKKLLEQLKVGGTMVIPIYDNIWQIRKTSETDTNIEKFERFEFVPLIIE
ncbi:MAG: protein-L-isoaspartate(D-aspartate) O-methyltransferase [Parcubacteria group bacterium]|nr:protein-L-isoaspartate(D-aspartate) O-methyltransferase [Parcubacteria group bacterium]